MFAPIHIASRNGNVEAIRWAKQANKLLREMDKELFDFNLAGGKQRWTPLHFAAYFGHFKIVEELLLSTDLLKNHIPINLYARTADLRTPRQTTRGGELKLKKIFRKAEQRYLKFVLDILKVKEKSLVYTQAMINKKYAGDYNGYSQMRKALVLIR